MKVSILLLVLSISFLSCGKSKNQLEDQSKNKTRKRVRDSIFDSNKNLESTKLEKQSTELQQSYDEKKIELLRKYNAKEDWKENWSNIDTFAFVKQEITLKYPIGFNGRILDVTKLNDQYNIQTIYTENNVNDLLTENIYISDILATKQQTIKLIKNLSSNRKINRGYFIIKVMGIQSDKIKDDGKVKNRLKFHSKLIDVFLYEDEKTVDEMLDEVLDKISKETIGN